MIMEEWKEHKSGLKVSNIGRVLVPRNVSQREHITFGHLTDNGYLEVRWNYKNYRVHRLVAECFLQNDNNYPTVDHIDRNRTNNNVENLRWASYKMQRANSDDSKVKETCSKKVYQYSLTGELINIYYSQMEAERNTGVKNHCISKCCNGDFKQANGYVWKHEPIPYTMDEIPLW